MGRTAWLSLYRAMDEPPPQPPSPEEPPAEEPPWEVNEYRFEPPGWFLLLFAGKPAFYPPFILLIGWMIWRWVWGEG